MSDYFLNAFETQSGMSRSYENILPGHLHYLESHSQQLLRKWVSLYLSTFGRKSFFSPERVEKIFSEMIDLFLSCLRSSKFDTYFEALKQKGGFFSELGVPFEEVVLCLKLFEEAYLSLILQNRNAERHKVKEVVMAFEELNNLSTAILAVSYFKRAKKSWESVSKGHLEENDRLKRELRTLHEDLLTSTKNELTSMGLVISGISQKLRKSVVRSRRIQVFAESLDQEPNFKNFLKIADKFFKQILPEGSQIVFGLFDENQKKVTLYSNNAEQGFESSSPPRVDEIFFSQLPLEYQETLFSESKANIVFEDPKRLPRFLSSIGALKAMNDFLFLPLKKYHDSIGFVFFASSIKDVFSGKNALKYYQRLGRVFANALFGQIYFDRYKRHSEFISILDQLEERVLQRNPLESTIDFCLGSMIELMDVERASLMLMDKSKKRLSIYAAKGYKVYPFSGLVLKLGEGIAGWSAKESKIISIPRMKNGSEKTFLDKSVRSSNQTPHMQVRSLLCVPLVYENETIGVINLSTLSYHKNFEQSEIDMINQFAHRVSLAFKSLSTVKEIEGYIKPHLYPDG